jgi:excisionase family DNA binding protein
MENFNTDDFVTASEVAKLLNVSRATIHRWIKQGKLNAIRFGSSSLVFLSTRQVQQLMEQRGHEGFPFLISEIFARRKRGWDLRVRETDEPNIFWLEITGANGESLRAKVEIIEQSGIGEGE